ncbi:uncharacterized protein LOC129581468 [Paramacrobiotus metropolitanus]|uniref:uncharacterized protein LOC129581468 n=1 Tax=Paramacrobiotus metropolitanus TaxID=2943436 RepID=UPI002445B0D0|nr:uncharacterized protein LOC129581468 [Paramacrobiotus metropolitanus]
MQLVSILPLFLLIQVYGRHIDRGEGDYSDPNGVKAEYDPTVIPEDTIIPDHEAELAESLPENEPELPDSCDDFPPPSCIKHFSALPPIIQRSPFALRTSEDFRQVCTAYKQALQCFGDYIARCKPDQPEARTFIDQMSGLLNQCENPQIQQDALAALDCGKRMSSVHERCMRETRFIPQLKTLSSERLVQGETNSIRDLCCGMRYHKACFMDQVQERCGSTAYEATQRLEAIILPAFQCDSVSESDCPSIRS